MADNGKQKEDWTWINYVVGILFFFLSFIAITVYSFSSFSSLAKNEAARVGLRSVEIDAEAFNHLLDESKSRLEIVWRVTDHILQDGDSLEGVQNFFVSETQRYRAEKDSSFTGVYGLIYGHYLDGGGWVPPEGYNPSERPWFQAAIYASDDKVQLQSFYDMSDHQYVVSASHILSDRRSVVALNVSLKRIRTRYVESRDTLVQWMLLDRKGNVIDHYDSSEVGNNYLSDAFWGSEKERAARQIIRAGRGIKEIVHDGEEAYAFIAPLQNDWLMVSIMSKSMVTQKVRWVVTRNVLIALLLFIALSAFLAVGLVKNRRRSKMERTKNFILKKMGEGIGATINGVLGVNSVVLKSVHDEDTKTFVEKVNGAVSDIGDLVSDVDEVVNLSDETFEYKKDVYDLFSLIADCYRKVLIRAAMKNLQISLECDPEIPSSLWGDEKRIRHAINNILSDAVKRTESGGVLIAVGFDRIPAVDGSKEHIILRFSIRDTGEGIGVGRGVGDDWTMASAELGLANLLLESCGGELMVKSRYGESTTFMVSIPQIVVNVEPIGDFLQRYEETSIESKEKMVTLFAPAARILVVDDVDMNLKVVRGLLKGTKVQIDTAMNSNQCLEMVAARHYDLILLDYSLPVVDGVRTFGRMQKMENSLNRETPVIMSTTKAAELSESYLKLGIADFISKPFTEQDLMRMMAWYLPKQLVLTQDDLEEPVRRKSARKPEKQPETDDNMEELVFQSYVSPAEKLKVFDKILDVNAGLEYFSHDAHCYTEILQEFVREDRQAAFRKTFLTKDWNNYLVLVHSVNGVAMAIGAHVLASKCREIEIACKESRFDDVLNLHDNFITAYVECLDYIKKGLSEYEV